MSRDYSNVTFTISLPRSRTAWLANTFGRGARASHDPLARCASVDELGTSLIDPALDLDPETPILIVDTAAVFLYPQIVERFPGAKFLFIERPYAEVEASLIAKRQPIVGLTEALACYRKAQIRSAADLPSHRRMAGIGMSELSYAPVLRLLWKFIGIQTPPPDGYLEQQIGINFQIPFDEQRRRGNPGKFIRLLATRHKGW